MQIIGSQILWAGWVGAVLPIYFQGKFESKTHFLKFFCLKQCWQQEFEVGEGERDGKSRLVKAGYQDFCEWVKAFPYSP